MTELVAVRAWENETIRALGETRWAVDCKNRLTTQLACQLADVLKVFTFIETKEHFDKFVGSIRSSILEPAIALKEKLALDTKCYYFEAYDWSKTSPDQSTALLMESMDEFDCFNVLENGKRFGRAALDNGSGPANQLGGNLQFLCAITPALLCREIHGEMWQKQQMLKKSKVIIAWAKNSVIEPYRKAPGLLASLIDIERHKRHSLAYYIPSWWGRT